ncbi:EAL domain-containing protein [Sulfurovum sp.]|uniref:EAL domain-containing protein n=1 Tax=Sulfurovum sp. TaxID=1969726 RepID=UPI0028681A53|nr:EAL domain-containing protein [Sulfurovum sp.]
MKSINTYYIDKEHLRLFIFDENISNSSSLLIQVFSSINDETFISTLVSELTHILPDAVIIGSTTDGEIMNGKVSSGKVVLSFTEFEHTTLKAAYSEHQINGYFSGQYLANELIEDDTKLLIAFVDGLHTNGEEFLKGVNDVKNDIIIAGGHAGDNSQFIETMVFTKDKILFDGAVAVSLTSKHLHVHTDYSFNWYPLGNELTITKALGNRVYTIDGKSAVETYAHYLGKDIANGLPGIGIEFPLIVNRNGSDVSRAAIGKEDDGSIIVGGNLYTGEKVRIGYGDTKEIVEKSKKIVESTSKKPSEAIFIYSCSTRKYFLGEEVESETIPLQAISPVSGFFTYGEFFTSDKKELLNQTMTLVSLSESETFIERSKNTKEDLIDINRASIGALTHLINMSSEEIEKSHQLNKVLQERMELALIGSNDGVWDWNMITNSVYFSPRWKEMLGYRDDELPNVLSTWSDFLHPDDIDRAWEDANKNINKETEYYESIYRLKHKDGHWVWILDRGKALFDESGKAFRMIGTHTDFTKEKENQLKLEAQSNIIEKLKERQELALVGSKTTVLDWDFTDNSMYISPSWKEMLGFHDQELPNRASSWSQRAHPEDRKIILKMIRAHQEQQRKNFEFHHRIKHKDGHWVWVLGRAQIFYDKNGKKVRMIGTHTDITEEKELQLKYSHHSQMIDQMHEAVNTTDLTGIVTSWNKGSELTYGYKAEEVIGKHISFLYSSNLDEELSAELAKVTPSLKEKGEYRNTLPFVKKSGETVLISLSLSFLRDEMGNPLEIVAYGQDVTERKKAEDALIEQKNILRHQALHDDLTGLPNRILFKDRLAHGIKTAERHATGLAVFFIDLDKFKQINDSLGHDVGDSVLNSVSKRLKNVIRKEDTLARLGGDEFTVIMYDLEKPEDAEVLAKKILKTLSEPLHVNSHILYVTGSIGISLYPENSDDSEALLKYADTAMYKAKEEGHNTFKFYSYSMTKYALDKMKMRTSLQQAIDNKEFILHYQPQINTMTKKLLGVEVLVRWEHPTRGLLYPDIFIPFAEETGMIIEIDRWVMKTAMKQVSKWYKAGLTPGVLATNLSIKQLECGDFLKKLQKRLEKYNFDPQWLELEITEGQMMKKPEDVIKKLNQINDLGVNISIDDFGTGYSSLLLLKRLPINRLKIDRSFVADIPDDEEDVAIIKAIIALAKSLKLDLIAEGVEIEQQKNFLIDNGCFNVQGHYYSHPISAEEMEIILLNHHTW